MSTLRIARVSVVVVFFAWTSQASGNLDAVATLDDVSVRLWATNSTVMGPELHVLLRNASEVPEKFTFDFGRRGQSGIACQAESASEKAGRAEAMNRASYHSRAALDSTSGIMPARGWTHRSFLVGGLGPAPCNVPYRLTLEDRDGRPRWLTDTVTVPLPERHEGHEIRPDDLRLDHVVEADRTLRRGTLLARILVENRSRLGTSVGITGMRFECPAGGAQPVAELHDSTLQGEDRGPVSLAPSGVGVFVIGVRAADGSLDECEGSVDVALFDSSGKRPLLRTHRFSLKPTGVLVIGGHGLER